MTPLNYLLRAPEHKAKNRFHKLQEHETKDLEIACIKDSQQRMQKSIPKSHVVLDGFSHRSTIIFQNNATYESFESRKSLGNGNRFL